MTTLLANILTLRNNNLQKYIKQRTMKQERKEALNKIFEKLELILNACILKNKGDAGKTMIQFNDIQVDIQNTIHKRNEELNLSKSEKEEIDKYYSSKMIELMSKYLQY